MLRRYRYVPLSPHQEKIQPPPTTLQLNPSALRPPPFAHPPTHELHRVFIFIHSPLHFNGYWNHAYVRVCVCVGAGICPIPSSFIHACVPSTQYPPSLNLTFFSFCVPCRLWFLNRPVFTFYDEVLHLNLNLTLCTHTSNKAFPSPSLPLSLWLSGSSIPSHPIVLIFIHQESSTCQRRTQSWWLLHRSAKKTVATYQIPLFLIIFIIIALEFAFNIWAFFFTCRSPKGREHTRRLSGRL